MSKSKGITSYYGKGREINMKATLHQQNRYNYDVAVLRYDTEAVSRVLDWI